MKLYSGNKLGIAFVYNPIQHDWMKYVWIDRNFIKSEIDSGKINLICVLIKLQEANVLTKALLKFGFESNVCKRGMVDMHSPT